MPTTLSPAPQAGMPAWLQQVLEEHPSLGLYNSARGFDIPIGYWEREYEAAERLYVLLGAWEHAKRINKRRDSFWLIYLLRDAMGIDVLHDTFVACAIAQGFVWRPVCPGFPVCYFNISTRDMRIYADIASRKTGRRIFP